MDRVYVVITVFLTLSVSLCWQVCASDPAPILCWTWKDTVCNGEKVFVCPCGGGSYIFASIRDQFNLPMPNLPVSASFESACSTSFCEDVTTTTDAAGEAMLHICAGFEAGDVTTCCSVTTTVTCLGYNVPYCETCPPPGGPGGNNDTRQWLSPDVSQEAGSEDTVEGLDYSFLVGDWLSNACRFDLDCDGLVGGLDFALFAEHWLHDCTACQYPG